MSPEYDPDYGGWTEGRGGSKNGPYQKPPTRFEHMYQIALCILFGLLIGALVFICSAVIIKNFWVSCALGVCSLFAAIYALISCLDKVKDERNNPSRGGRKTRRIGRIITRVLFSIALIVICFCLVCLNKDRNAFEKAQKVNSEIAYESYIKNHPKGIYVEEAGKRADKLAFDKAKNSNSASSYSKYLESYPDGYSVKNAKKRLHNILTNEAKQLEKKFLWKEAGAKWQEAYHLTQNQEDIGQKNLCEYNQNHPVEILYPLREIKRKPTDFLINAPWPGETHGEWPTSTPVYYSDLVTFSATITSISSKPVRSVVLRTRESFEFHPAFYQTEILHGKILSPGQKRKVTFQIKCRNGQLLSWEEDPIMVNGKKIE